MRGADRVRLLLATSMTVTMTMATSHAVAQTYTEPFRPQFHYTPAQTWMNDPNGLLYYNGKFHLFYQNNPLGNTDGNLSWGHAVSTDLLHWTQLPVALQVQTNSAGAITQEFFSGSAVVDTNNTSGLGTPGHPAMIAMYTSEYPIDQTLANGTQIRAGTQAQSIAYSLDEGTTWNQYAGDPVIAAPPTAYADQYTNFRDPKLFWYARQSKWVVVTSLASEHKLLLYSSKDLKNWTYMSSFGPSNATNGAWECPDLFRLPVDGNANNTKWVMMIGSNPGSITAGSGTQYFVGNFDGTTFTADANQIYDHLPPAGSTVFQDFEKSSYSAIGWTATGDFVGTGPAMGTLTGQTTVSGYQGKRLVNTFIDGDVSEGTITSPAFTISKPYIDFLIGGGYWPYNAATYGTASDTEVGVNLLVNNKVVATATGSNTETLEWRNWDVSGYLGKTAQIQIVDHNQAGFGHLDFDDVVFSDTPKQEANWVDFGPDFYAASTWNGLPENTQIAVAWMNNWNYAGAIPVSPWRGADSIPRALALQTVNGKISLTQQPVGTLSLIEGTSIYTLKGYPLSSIRVLPFSTNEAKTADISVQFQVGNATSFGLKVHTGTNGEQTVIGYDTKARALYIDRTNSGQTSFSSDFPGGYTVPLAPDANGQVALRILVDWSSVEVFGQNGQAQLTAQVFPASTSNGVSLFATGGTALVQSMSVLPVRSVWPAQ